MVKRLVRVETITLKLQCADCGVVEALLLLDAGGKPALRCVSCYVAKNAMTGEDLESWLANYKKMRGGGKCSMMRQSTAVLPYQIGPVLGVAVASGGGGSP